MVLILLYVLLGLGAGVLSGIVGIGGGIIIVPAFVFLFGMNQKDAQGTTLALLVPPVGLLAAITYYRNGNVDLKIAAFVCIGLFVGAFIGSKIAEGLSSDILRRVFGIVLVAIGAYMLFKRGA